MSRRSRSRPREGRPGSLFWPLLGLAALGAGAAAVVLAYRRGYFGLDPEEFDPGPLGEELFPPAPRLQDLALWLPGPAGNLFVRDGGSGGAQDLPVLFVHSLGGNGGQWVLQLDDQRPERRAVALDLRGHGESDPAEGDDYSIAGLAADVASVADQLGLRRFVLVGHSLGSLAAIEYAGQHPERVAGLFLVDPNGDQTQLPKSEVEPFLESIRRNPRAEIESYFRQLVVGGDPDAARWILEDLAATSPRAIVGCLEAAAVYSPLPALERYRGPKLAAVSHLNSLPISLHRLVPDLPVHPIGGTGHWVQLDRPEVVNRLLDEFLAEVEAE